MVKADFCIPEFYYRILTLVLPCSSHRCCIKSACFFNNQGHMAADAGKPIVTHHHRAVLPVAVLPYEYGTSRMPYSITTLISSPLSGDTKTPGLSRGFCGWINPTASLSFHGTGLHELKIVAVRILEGSHQAVLLNMVRSGNNPDLSPAQSL